MRIGRRYHLALAVFLAAGLAHAGDDASTEGLALAGAGMAIPTYFLGVAIHESSHALAARAFGAEILELSLFPSVRYGRFYFGYTRWRGELTDCEKVWALLMPKVSNAILFGGYTALVLTDTLPSNDYGRLAITVLGTGQWVDFTRSLFSFSDGDDLVRVHMFYGRTTEWQRLPWRLLYAGLSAAGGYVLYRGWRDVFEDDYSPAVVVPVVWTF
jgi:hypothetical protein